MSIASPTPSRQSLVLAAALRCMAPLVRWLVRHGVSYPALAQALKAVFVEAAQAEIKAQGMKRTDSAVTLLSGVHRKDLRLMQQAAQGALGVDGAVNTPSDAGLRAAPLSMVGEVVARWMSDPRFRQGGAPMPLPRSARATADELGGDVSFDTLVRAVSQDVRPRAILDEMLRLGVVSETDEGLRLREAGLVPHQGFDAMTEALAINLADHAATACSNLDVVANEATTVARDASPPSARQLEQAMYVDEITAESAAHLHDVSRQAWLQAFNTVMAAMQQRFDHDAQHATPAERKHRVRVGIYFHQGKDSGHEAD